MDKIKKILVAGGTGFIGSRFVRMLLDRVISGDYLRYYENMYPHRS